MDKQIYNFNETKKILGLGTNTLLDLFKSDEFNSFKVGNRWYISKEELEKWIKNRCK